MSELAIPGELTPTSLTLPPTLSQEEWMRVGETLKTMSHAMQWWVGDWLAHGENRWGEEAYAILERKDKTFANWAYVCRAVPPTRRREELAFSHHAEVASLEPARQEEVLGRAAEEHMTVKQIREIVREVEDEGYDIVIKVETRPCPMCLGEGILPLEEGE